MGIAAVALPPERGPRRARDARRSPRGRRRSRRRATATRRSSARGEPFVFTTHTPVPAGNETYGRDEVLTVLGRLFYRAQLRPARGPRARADAPDAGRREHRADAARDPRLSVDQRGQPAPRRDRPRDVARDVPARQHRRGADHATSPTPCTSPTWMAPPMRALLTECFGQGWERHASDPVMWKQVDDIPDDELWRCAARSATTSSSWCGARSSSTASRAARTSTSSRPAATRSTRPTSPSASRDGSPPTSGSTCSSTTPSVPSSLLDHDRPLQFVFAGKAHPLDDAAKAFAQRMFDLKRVPEVGNKVVFLEDYDLSVGHDRDRRLRRVAEPAPTAARGERHERDEGGAQRLPEPERPRRVVDGGLRRHQRLGHRRRRRPRRERQGRARRTGALRPRGQRGQAAVLRARRARRARPGGSSGSVRRCGRSVRGSAPRGCSTTT